MTTLFSQEDVLEAYVEEVAQEREDKAIYREAKETAARMIQDGKILLEDIVRYVPSLSMAEIKQIASDIASQA